MPDHRFEAPSDEPLFPDDDPLTISIPGVRGAEPDSPEAGGTFRCLDRANPPLEEDVDPATRPVGYLIELLRLQVVEEERDAFEAALVSAVRDNRVMLSELIGTATWIGEQRAEAEKGTVARVAKRPTKARQRSTR